MQLHDILLLRTSAILPEAISAGGLTPTTDTSLFLTTYRGGSHLPAEYNVLSSLNHTIFIITYFFAFLPIKIFICISYISLQRKRVTFKPKATLIFYLFLYWICSIFCICNRCIYFCLLCFSVFKEINSYLWE